MINLLHQCTKYGSYVTDSIESEIEQHEKIKTGNYINGVWICNGCIAASQRQKKKRENEENSSLSSSLNQNNSSSSNNQCKSIGVASKSDVSPILQKQITPTYNIHINNILLILF
jgi:hypothetical protein